MLYEIRHVYSPCLIPTSDVIYMRKYDNRLAGLMLAINAPFF